MHGDWLLMLDESTADCFLLRITTNPRTKIQLPPLHQPPLFLSTYEMLESPESANCTILVASSTEAEEECYLLHCHPGDEMWTKSVSPYDDISFSSLMRNYGGKIYDFASNLIAIDVIDGKIELQQLGTIKDEEEDSRRCGRYHIIESCGKLFLLWIDDLGCFYDDGLLTAIRVFCLNLETLSWERVEGIGNDRAFLISGTYAFSCPSIEGVLQGNCVYLVWSSCDSERLYKFCLDDMTISFHQILPQPTKSWSRAFWAIPASENYNIQVTIFDTNEDRHIFRSSKDGWVLASAGIYGNDIFIINPFTEEIVEPPMLAFLYNYNDCAFFGINSSDSGKFLSTFTWQHGEPHWIEQEFEYNVSFPVGYNNPVMFDGKFYCLGRKGNLGVFDPTSNTWRILDKPEPIHVEMDLFEEDHIGREFCYLVDMDGELISVFLRNANELPRVFKLNRTEISWVEVEDIGGGALFLDYRSSYGVASPDGGNGNRIYFPRYSKDGKPVFYDMNKKTYSPSFYGVIEPLNCVWVVPNLRKNESTSED
ncbi:hypothetical protein DAI22_08g172100 [Oryza sativa Japonica Group]|nr:hypothetical protein DAI22_08g172100 [Oryza sativa Japonica Group]